MLQLHNSSWEPKKALFTGGSATTPAFILAKTETRRCVIRWPTLPRRAGTRLQLPCRHSNSSVIKLLVTNQGRYVMGVDRNSFGLGLHMLAKPHGGVAVTRTATRVAGFAVVGELAKEVRDSSLRDEMADELVSRVPTSAHSTGRGQQSSSMWSRARRPTSPTCRQPAKRQI